MRSKEQAAASLVTTQLLKVISAPRLLCLFYLLFVLLLVSRRPDCVFNSQFWAEEGKRFHVEAVERSAWINLTTYSFGYFDLLLRSLHQLAALFPLKLVPRFLNLAALAVQAAVPTFVLSQRCAGWMGSFPVRLAAALLYCGMPNSFETHGIELHSRVHLAVLAVLVVISAPSVSLLGKIFDCAILILSGLSGPFVIVLAPVALWRFRQSPTPATRRNAIILGLALIFGIFALIFSSSPRLGVSLGLSVGNLVRIIGGQFTLGWFLGLTSYTRILHSSWFNLAAAAAFIGIVLLFGFLFWRGTKEARCLSVFGLGTLAMALAAPIGALDMPQWVALWSIPGCGQRYYFIPMAMALFILAAAAGRDAKKLWRSAAGAFLILLAVGGERLDWRLPPFSDLHFRRYARRYESLPPGASITIPINPPGWEMELRKPAKP